MSRVLAKAAAATALALFAQVGLAQDRVLQFDLNALGFQSYDAAGAPVPFGGATHTGTVEFSDVAGVTGLESISISTGGGGFVNQPGEPWNLTNAVMSVNLVNGVVTGGELVIDISGGGGGGGDTYSAGIAPGGTVSPFVGGGFLLEALTISGAFSDASYGPVNVSDFFAAQGTPPFLQGSFLNFNFDPAPNGSGFADAEVFVSNIPSPGSLGCIAAGMVIAARRRRR